MSCEKLITFTELLSSIDQHSEGWVYLPANEPWSLESPSTVLKSDEVPPELEDDPQAGVPAFARQNNLMQALPVSTVRDIVSNVKSQRRDAPLPLLFKAFLFCYDHDAFIKLE